MAGAGGRRGDASRSEGVPLRGPHRPYPEGLGLHRAEPHRAWATPTSRPVVDRIDTAAAAAVARMTHAQWLSVSVTSATTRGRSRARARGQARAAARRSRCDGHVAFPLRQIGKRAAARCRRPSQSPNGRSKRSGGQVLRRQPALTRDQHLEMSEGRAAGALRSVQGVPSIEFGVAAPDRGGRRRAVARGSRCRARASSRGMQSTRPWPTPSVCQCFTPKKRPVELPVRCGPVGLAVQADVYAGLGLWRRVDRPILRVERPPALGVAINHPALDAVQLCILDGFLRRAEDERRPAHAQNGRRRIQHDHAVANRAIRHVKALQKNPPQRSSFSVASAPRAAPDRHWSA